MPESANLIPVWYKKKILGWCLSIRFKPLIVGVGPVFIGISLSFSGWDHFSWLLNGSILFCIFCIQTATHFFNDAFDFLKGADNISRKGPKRAIQKGWLTPSQLFKGGVFCLFLATLVGGYLVWQGGWPVFCIGVVSLALAYFYTGGSYSLAYTGLADIFVLLFFGLLPVAAVFYLNTGYWDEGSIVAGLQCGFLALSLLVVNNLRDEEEDRKAKKKTLVVRWGRKFGIWEWTLAHYLPYLLTSYWFFKSVGRMAFLPFVLFPFSIYLHSLLYKAFKKENIYSRVFAFT
ncbi:MAG: 1,4-dihydroxy-2-naphthoate octaprenyltransferase, partial [Oligoflexia bacterium]|nr:1,4-dihydroxy-2-naphthoate octaprenyltransferase [Oligoflexia bacterium]